MDKRLVLEVIPGPAFLIGHALGGIFVGAGFISLLRAGANEIVRRSYDDRTWAIYNGVSDVAWIAVFVVVTSLTARRYWNGPA